MDELSRSDYLSDPNKKYPKPKNIEKMISLAATLSKDFMFVRVDFYEINGKLYLGELTFTPGAGFFRYKTPETNKLVGNMLALC